MDEVEIKNVGGRNGVASEVTLQRLLDATSQNSGNAANAARTRQRLVETNNKAQADNTSILGKATAGVKGLAKEFVSGGNRVSDFSSHILGASSRLQNLVEYLDSNVDQFRSLSQVGAGFNNSIFDMMTSAGLSAMRMDEFYRSVQDNSEVLRMLGGSVTEGAKRFGDISKGMRQGDIGNSLFNLGYTIGDVNDGFMNYVNNQALQGRLAGRSNTDLIKGSQDYLVEIDRLSKATGLSRDALMEQQQQLNNNSKFQALINNASAEGASNLSRNIGVVANLLGPQFADDLTLMASGAGGMSELYRGLVASGSAGQELASILENAGNMTKTEFLGAIRVAGPAVAEEFDNLLPGVQAMLERGGSDLATAFNSRGALASMQNLSDAADAEQAARDNVTNFLAQFSNQLQQVKTNVLDKIIESDFGTAVTNLGTSLSAALTSLFGSNAAGGTALSGSFGSLSDGISAAVTALTGPEGYLTKLTDTIRGEVEAFTAATSPTASNRQSPMDYLRERAGELGTQLKNWFTDMFLGPINDEMGMSRSGGILGTIKDGFSNLMNGLTDRLFPPNEAGDSLGTRIGNKLIEGLEGFFNSETGQRLTSTISYYFEGLMLSLQEAIDSKIGILSNSRLEEERESFEEKGLAEGRLSQSDAARVTARLQEKVDLGISSMQSQLSYGLTPSGDQVDTVQSAIGALRAAGQDVIVPEGLPVRRVGTLKATGQTTEPADTVAQIHKGERVLNPSETGAMNDLPGAINQLNTLTAQIRDLMAQSVGHQERTARGIKKLGSDIMT